METRINLTSVKSTNYVRKEKCSNLKMLITIKTIDIEEKCNSFCKKLTYFFVSTVYYNFLSEGIIWRVRAHTHDQIQSSFLQFFLTIKLNLCSNYILRNIICDMQERRTFLIFAGNFSETQ